MMLFSWREGNLLWNSKDQSCYHNFQSQTWESTSNVRRMVEEVSHTPRVGWKWHTCIDALPNIMIEVCNFDCLVLSFIWIKSLLCNVVCHVIHILKYSTIAKYMFRWHLGIDTLKWFNIYIHCKTFNLELQLVEFINAHKTFNMPVKIQK